MYIMYVHFALENHWEQIDIVKSPETGHAVYF